MKKTKGRVIALRISEDVYKKLKALTDSEVSFSMLVRFAIAAFLDAKLKK